MSQQPATSPELEGTTQSPSDDLRSKQSRKVDRDMASDSARLNVNINARTAAELRRIAHGAGISYTEAVRRAVEVLAFVTDERNAGHAIQTYDPARDVTKELITL